MALGKKKSTNLRVRCIGNTLLHRVPGWNWIGPRRPGWISQLSWQVSMFQRQVLLYTWDDVFHITDTYIYIYIYIYIKTTKNLNADNVCELVTTVFSEASTLPTVFYCKIGPISPGKEATRNRPGQPCGVHNRQIEAGIVSRWAMKKTPWFFRVLYRGWHPIHLWED